MNKTITDWDAVPAMLSAQDLADLLGVSRQTAWRKMKDGTFPTVDSGSGLRVSKMFLQESFGIRPLQMAPEVDPQVIHHLERAQYHANQAMRILEEMS